MAHQQNVTFYSVYIRSMEIYTIGHSTRSFAEFASLLKRYGIEVLVDVRAFPTSTRNPQFVKETLKQHVEVEAIDYVWLGEKLGGYRRDGLGEESPNKGWKTQGFRNYADYMMTAPFERQIERIMKLASSRRLAVMCAERFYWRCHRRLISDYLVAKGHAVIHIVDAEETIEHKLSKFARVSEGTLRYPTHESSQERLVR